MDNNQINSLADTNVNDPVMQPVTPEGMPLNIDSAPSREQKIELHPEIESKKENNNTTTKENNNESSNDINLTQLTIQTTEPEKANIVDKTTTQNSTQPLETIDRLSILADEDEKDFINNVKAAHEHT